MSVLCLVFQAKPARGCLDVFQTGARDQEDAGFRCRNRVTHLEPRGKYGARRWFGEEARSGGKFLLGGKYFRICDGDRSTAVSLKFGQGVHAVARHMERLRDQHGVRQASRFEKSRLAFAHFRRP